MVEIMKTLVTPSEGPMMHCCAQCPDPAAATITHASAGDSWASLGQSLAGSLLFSPGVHKVLLVPSKSLFPQSCVSSVIKSHCPTKSNSLGVSASLPDPQVGKSVVGARNFFNSARISLE